MCEKRARKIKKGSHITRLREARRLQRIQRMTPSPAAEEPTPGQLPQSIIVDKTMQSKVILELAWKTVALMHKNKLIQQKILDLQKETSEFVAAILNSPENRQRYIDYFKTRATDDIPVPHDYACSPFSSESYSSFSSYSPSLSPSSSSMSEPMSPQWEEETHNLTIKTEDVFFKTEPDV